MKLLASMNAAYSCSDALQQDESQFWRAKRFYDFLRSIALPDYYTIKRWRKKYTAVKRKSHCRHAVRWKWASQRSDRPVSAIQERVKRGDSQVSNI